MIGSIGKLDRICVYKLSCESEAIYVNLELFAHHLFESQTVVWTVGTAAKVGLHTLLQKFSEGFYLQRKPVLQLHFHQAYSC